MDLRRALLLFAIVLGVAAIASSITRPSDRGGDDTSTDGATRTTGDSSAPAATSGPGTAAVDPATIRFSSSGKRKLRKLERGRPATVLVAVDVPGQVEIPTLGLTQPAEPLTPARFDVLVPQAGSHRIVLRPADPEARQAPIGTLKVVAGP